jgi:hypothetical protein
MRTDEALDFLRQHQPMPPTKEVQDELIQHLSEVMRFFSEHPDPRCVPLLLNCFGEGDGHGVYQMMDNVIRPFPDEVVVPALAGGLRSSLGSVKFWCTQIAADRPHPGLEGPLIDVLNCGTDDERYFAAVALGMLNTPSSRDALQQALVAEKDEEVKGLIRDVLDRCRS